MSFHDTQRIWVFSPWADDWRMGTVVLNAMHEFEDLRRGHQLFVAIDGDCARWFDRSKIHTLEEHAVMALMA